MNEFPQPRIALLIDADNAPAELIDEILTELSTLGVINIRRAYGNWTKSALGGWQSRLLDFAIRPMQQFDYSKRKNASDMAMTVDAMELLYTERPDAFGIVSSDADFTPLVMHLRAKGAKVYGFGAKKTPAPFVNACSRFLYLETLGEDTQPAASTKAGAGGARRSATAALKQDARLVTLLRTAAEATAGEDGWSTLGALGQHIGNQASFDPRNHGYKKLVDLIEATQLFDIDRRGSQVIVRDRRLAKK